MRYNYYTFVTPLWEVYPGGMKVPRIDIHCAIYYIIHICIMCHIHSAKYNPAGACPMHLCCAWQSSTHQANVNIMRLECILSPFLSNSMSDGLSACSNLAMFADKVASVPTMIAHICCIYIVLHDGARPGQDVR